MNFSLQLIQSNNDEFKSLKMDDINSWILIQNENGVKNKITNNLKEEPIQGFYMYKL